MITQDEIIAYVKTKLLERRPADADIINNAIVADVVCSMPVSLFELGCIGSMVLCRSRDGAYIISPCPMSAGKELP